MHFDCLQSALNNIAENNGLNMKAHKQKKVAILGSGLIGRMLAVILSQPHSSFTVTLLDKDSEKGTGSAAYLAAAMLAPVSESVDCSATIMQMGERSLRLWPNFLQQLVEPVFFQKNGSLILAYEQDEAHLTNFQRRLKNQTAQPIQTIALNNIADIEPSLKNHAKRFAKALFLPNEGQLDNRQLLTSMAKTLHQNEVEWYFNRDLEFDKHPEHLEQLKQEYDWVIDCRGLGAKADIPEPSKLRGVRGEVIRVYAPQVELSRPIRLMHPRYPIYIAPKENHHFVIGATQIESEDLRQPTVRSGLELLSSCFSVHTGFAEAEILEIRAGLRPALHDNEPKIWIDNNLITINGLFRHGYLIAPTLVEQCLAIVENRNMDLPFTTQLVIDKSTASKQALQSVVI